MNILFQYTFCCPKVIWWCDGKKCLSYPNLVMIRCILMYIFIGRCSIDLNIASCTSIFFNRLKSEPSILCLAILCGYDFISKANNVSISPWSPFVIYPQNICSLPLHFFSYSCDFFFWNFSWHTHNFSLMIIFSQKIIHNVICQRRFFWENYYHILLHELHHYHWLVFLGFFR